MEFLTSLHQYSDWGLLALRIALGVIFLVHGPPKVMHPERASAMGFAVWFWVMLGLGETIGALSMLLGFLTQIGAIILLLIMLGAHYFKMVVWKVPFTSMEKTGWEFDFMILSATTALVFLGGGSLSLDRIMFGL
ncbi:MAG TPA: DoxX family protein [Candidatus Peribacteraceae bacterium]|nr:DoxX family protein [Candidatus Peribacteraceae bacterium]